MEFIDAMPVIFKEIIPNNNIPEKWKEISLNTGGTHSTLQDIKLSQKAGGYWYEDSKKLCTRNRFIYWQTSSDAIELAEASLDVNLSGGYLRCKVAAGTPPLSSITIYEHSATNQMVLLAATVSSVHRLVFPHPTVLDKKSTFGSLSSTSPSIFQDTNAINNPNNYYILNQYSNATTGVAHTCASMLRENGEAVFALAFGHSGEGGLLLVKLPVAGSAVTTLLKRESTVPRFLAGLTGALRGKSNNDGVETYEVVLTHTLAVAICGDTCLRAWTLDEGGVPIAVSAPLTQTIVRPKPPPHGHMMQKTEGPDGGITLVAYLSFPNECEFVVMRMHSEGAGNVRFSHICRIFGPQLDLLDYAVSYGDGNNVIWALWSQPDGDTLITSSAVSAEAAWRAVAARDHPSPLPQLSNHQQYRDRLLTPGLFPTSVIRKALSVYKRTWCAGISVGGALLASTEGEVGEVAMSAVTARVAHLAARTSTPDQTHLMHKCWADLYSWCLQYMEGLQKPLGLMISKQGPDVDGGWWCAVVRRAGISLVCELEPLERMLLSPEAFLVDSGIGGGEMGDLSTDAVRVVVAGARWENAAGAARAADLERRLFACLAPQHRLLPRLLHLLRVPTAPQDSRHAPTLTPQQIDELTVILEPIKDLHVAVLELNNALKLDVPECDTSKMVEAGKTDEYDSLFASDLGVAVVTEAIRQMAEMRCRVLRGVLAALGLCRGAGDVPGAGHCAVHWQAYRALLWLRAATLQPPSASSLEGFRLKLNALEAECAELVVGSAGVAGGGVMQAYAASAGGARARARLHAAAVPVLWHQALPFFTYHLAHQLWAVSGGFEFGSWLSTINQPRLVHNYVTLLEPWCERNACSRQFILGLALLDMEDSEGAYSAFCKAAKGVSTENFLRKLIAGSDCPTHHQALVLYYMKVIKLFEIHDAGACVVRLAETAISIADKDDPNLPTCQWLVFKWHLSGGRTSRALSAAAACTAPHARATAAAALLTALGERGELGALVRCPALAGEAERAAAARAKLIDAHAHNPYYDFLYSLHLSRHHYRKAAAVMYERAARCRMEENVEGENASGAGRRKWLAAAITCLRLAKPEHAFIACPSLGQKHNKLQVIGPEELTAELRDEDPDSIGAVQQALLKGENIDFDMLYTVLKEATSDTLLAVTKRAISTSQFLPRWFLQRYMEVDGAGCVRALLNGGRASEAATACCEAIRCALMPIALPSPHLPRAAPLALADLLLAELEPHVRQPYIKQIYEELDFLVKEYTQVIVRTSDDMKLAGM